MPKKLSVLIILIVLCLSAACLTTCTVLRYSGGSMDSYETIEDRGFFTSWNPGIPGGIPEVTSVFRTISPSGGNDAAAINRAIQDAGAAASASNRQAVQLSEGIFYIGTNPIILDRSHVVLRGQGASTVIRGHNVGQGAILIGPTMGHYNRSNSGLTGVVGNVRVNDTSITVQNARGFKPGDILELDRLADDANINVASAEAAAAGGREFNNTGGSGNHDQFMRRPDRDSQHGPISPDGLRLVSQLVEIERIEDNTLYLTNTINIDFPQMGAGNKRLNPQIWNTGAQDFQYIGLEDVKLQITARSARDGQMDLSSWAWNLPAIRFQLKSSYSWARNVWSDGTWFDETGRGFMGKHIEIDGFRNHVTGSAFIGSSQNASGGNSYGIRPMGTDNLIDNNIVDLLCRPILGQNTGGGNVIAYNYVPNAYPTPFNNGAWHPASTKPPLPDYTQPIDNWVQDTINTSHGSYCHSDLFEGNFAANLSTDAVWGNTGLMVFFRNHAAGVNAGNFSRWMQNLGAVRIGNWMTEHVSIGNVYLTPETVAAYQNAKIWDRPGDSAPSNRLVVYRFDSARDAAGAAFAYERFFWAHDFNYINNEVLSREADDSWPFIIDELPNSLYLSEAPAYFDGYVWPPVNPYGATNDERAGLLPAKARYENLKALAGSQGN